MFSRKSRQARLNQRWLKGQKATNYYRDLVARTVQPGMRVLHAGCGWDKLGISKPLRETCTVVGMDLDPRVEKMFHSEFHLGSLEKTPFKDGEFDLILCEYVLEHLENPEIVFGELNRVLKPGGYFILLTPNLWSYKSLVSRITPQAFHIRMGQIRFGKGHEEDMYPTVYRSNSESRLKVLCSKFGFRPVEMTLVTNGPTWMIAFPVLFELFDIYHRAIDNISSLRFLRCAIAAKIQKIA